MATADLSGHGAGVSRKTDRRAIQWRWLELLIALLAIMANVPCMGAEEPDRVHPSTGTAGKLRQATAAAAETIGEHLDAGHDWLYRRLQNMLEKLDIQFGRSGEEPIVVPLSPLRIGLGSEFVHRPGGFAAAAALDLEASLLLPNIERRFKLIITSADLPESPRDPAAGQQPVRVGARIAVFEAIDLDLGVRAKQSPSAFAALRWTPEFTAGAVRVNPFSKVYVESGLGFGVSGGVSFERWNNRWIWRSATYANWIRNDSRTDWTQSFIVGHAQAVIQERRYDTLATGRDLACGTAARVSASGERASRASLYEASVMMKRPLRGGWLFGYAEPLIRWDRQAGWHPDIGVRIGFDALFWGLASLPGEVATHCR